MENLEKRAKDKFKAQMDNIKFIKQWPNLLEKLQNREVDPLNESQFCERHGIKQPQFNRLKNDKENYFPKQSFIDSVRSAFKAEKLLK